VEYHGHHDQARFHLAISGQLPAPSERIVRAEGSAISGVLVKLGTRSLELET
jgi:hypothetical protein